MEINTPTAGEGRAAQGQCAARVEHPLRVIKQQFGYAKVRYRGLEKNTARLTMLFALGNLWMARKRIMALLE